MINEQEMKETLAVAFLGCRALADLLQAAAVLLDECEEVLRYHGIRSVLRARIEKLSACAKDVAKKALQGVDEVMPAPPGWPGKPAV